MCCGSEDTFGGVVRHKGEPSHYNFPQLCILCLFLDLSSFYQLVSQSIREPAGYNISWLHWQLRQFSNHKHFTLIYLSDYGQREGTTIRVAWPAAWALHVLSTEKAGLWGRLQVDRSVPRLTGLQTPRWLVGCTGRVPKKKRVNWDQLQLMLVCCVIHYNLVGFFELTASKIIEIKALPRHAI